MKKNPAHWLTKKEPKTMIDKPAVIQAGNENDFSIYKYLDARDPIGLMRELFEKWGYKLREEDGKFIATLTATIDTPWIHVLPAIRSNGHTLDCYRWHKIMFDVVSSKLGDKAWVPSECQGCWKVVIRPQKITQLFRLEHIQRQLGRPSKCGLERRDYVFGNYGGYWYNESQEEGIECYQAVYEAIAADPVMADILEPVDENGKTKLLLLKRACTEFEKVCGPSDEWKITDEQMHVEGLVNKYVVPDTFIREQPGHLQNYVRKKWIEHAYTVGDPSVFELTGGQPLFKPYVTYHPVMEEKNHDES